MKSDSLNGCDARDTGFRLLNSVVQECNNRQASQPNEHTAGPTRKRNWEGDQVRVRFGELVPIVLQAAMDRHAWLDDFENETMIVSKDLYEILTTYHTLRRQFRNAA